MVDTDRMWLDESGEHSFGSESSIGCRKESVMNERDEVQELKRDFRTETSQVRVLRTLVTLAIVFTGVAITFTTYKSLVKEEDKNFTDAFEQFSRSVGNAAVSQQKSIQIGLQSFASLMTMDAIGKNATWPNYALSFYEQHARDMLDETGMEIVTVSNIVLPHEAPAYIGFVSVNVKAWFEENHMIKFGNLDKLKTGDYIPAITKLIKNGTELAPQDPDKEYYAPVWGYSPPPPSYVVANVDALSAPQYDVAMDAVLKLKNETVLTGVKPYASDSSTFSKEEHEAMHSTHENSATSYPHSFTVSPVHEILNDPESRIVAMVFSGFAWDAAWRYLVPEKVNGIVAVLSNTCDQTFTYRIDGPDAFFVGNGDLHDRAFSSHRREFQLSQHTHGEFETTEGHCMYSMTVYPSTDFQQSYKSQTPMITAIIIAATFGLVTLVFFSYDLVVQRRNNRLIENAARSNAVVSSLFPGSMRERVLLQGNKMSSSRIDTNKKMKSFLSNESESEFSKDLATQPLAELYTNVTVMFADVVGFTAWSSVRAPDQVFSLLEAVFGSFDKIAARRRVFKVETVGDCYVAVAGLPDPRSDHAQTMARLARNCMSSFESVTRKLDVVLGPDTSDLALRIGLHSGPVTAGVLRGDRARFQLFGDTMNTCARIESSSERGRIHVSKETATLLIAAGKSSWLTRRQDMVEAKGKGLMETYWIKRAGSSNDTDSNHSVNTDGMSSGGEDDDTLEDREKRLVDWNVETMLQYIRRIVARRNASKPVPTQNQQSITEQGLAMSKCFLEEWKDVIELPKFDHKGYHKEVNAEMITLDGKVVTQLREFVTCVAAMYRSNPFHNFEHASHVAMSTTKLLSRIVAPSDLELDYENVEEKSIFGMANIQPDKSHRSLASTLHDHTYGITSDPLTQFACVFGALIHDVDHSGVPNTQLIEEDATLSDRYNKRSVAEQNSLELAWSLLMQSRFADLRNVLFPTSGELKHFRALVVNCVLATDIADKDLKLLRNGRWDKAFSASSLNNENARVAIHRKATIVIEHLLQASDVSHTMQHWHVYRKWNERLFAEMYVAYKSGRSTTNPAEFWAAGEIGFFDFYILPLAQKLKECGVFGVSSAEYLNYALSNRREWALRGDAIVAEMVDRYNDIDLEPAHLSGPVCLPGPVQQFGSFLSYRFFEERTNL